MEHILSRCPVCGRAAHRAIVPGHALRLAPGEWALTLFCWCGSYVLAHGTFEQCERAACQAPDAQKRPASPTR